MWSKRCSLRHEELGLVAWTRGPNCGRDGQALQMESGAQVVGVGSPREGQVVKRSGERLSLLDVPWGAGGRKSTERRRESRKKGVTFGVVHATENSRERLFGWLRVWSPLKCLKRTACYLSTFKMLASKNTTQVYFIKRQVTQRCQAFPLPSLLCHPWSWAFLCSSPPPHLEKYFSSLRKNLLFISKTSFKTRKSILLEAP